jgi:hypothetical protein
VDQIHLDCSPIKLHQLDAYRSDNGLNQSARLNVVAFNSISERGVTGLTFLSHPT